MSRPGLSGTHARRALGAALAAALLGLVAACSGSVTTARPEASPSAADGTQHSGHPTAPSAPGQRVPLRPGEHFSRLAMPDAYTPKAPGGVGTDDYRCFLLDPHLAADAFVTGIDVLPGNRDVVHHVILFRVPPGSVAAAKAQDAAEPGEGWTCFGGTGLDDGARLGNAPWLGAWAPGGGERLMGDDVGVPLAAGSQVVMQVHYNLLAGPGPDVTAARLRMTSADRGLKPLETMLLPAPVELPCRPEHELERLCDRSAALADVQHRFGDVVGQTANYLHLLCGYGKAGPVQSCDQKVDAPATIRAVAGHMHLLGRSIRVDLERSNGSRQNLLDVKVWNFDNQRATVLARPVTVHPGDSLRVTCTHDATLREKLPELRKLPPRYVVWGEGSSDEMCLGIISYTLG